MGVTAARITGGGARTDAAGEADGVDDAGAPAWTGWLLALALLPLAVSAVALLTAVGREYVPTGDHAGTEIAVRSVGRHAVLTGLWSHADWNHPGPLSFYLLAPFYWLTGGASVGLNLGALAVNGGSIAGMAVVARRRGGRPLLLCTLVACALVLRTLGADVVHDFQNVVVVTLPFGLMLFLTWAMACRETWALPVGALVASFLSQTHVGFVALAVPLLVGGAVWLIVAVLRADGPNRAADRRSLRTAVLATAAVLAVVWAPPLADVLLHSPSNARRTFEWFRAGDEGVHGLGDGWSVVTGQFGLPPEWLAAKRPMTPSGESGFLHAPAVPVLLVPVGAAAVSLWRRRRDGRSLVVVLAAALVLGVLAVTRTVGPVMDYRLRWTWMPPLLAFVVVAWAAWLALVDRWGRRAERALTAAAMAGLVVLTAVNVAGAATAGTPDADDGAMVAALVPAVVEHLDPDAGPVVVSDPVTPGSWYGRALVLQLERRGFDVRVPRERAIEFTPHHAEESGPVQARLLVVRGDTLAPVTERSDVHLIARSVSERERARHRLDARVDRILSAAADRGLSPEEALADTETLAALDRLEPSPAPGGEMFATSLAVYLDERPLG